MNDSSVRRGALRAIIHYSNTHPRLPILRDNPRVCFDSRSQGRDLHTVGACVPSNIPVREALRLVGGGAWDLARETECYARVVGGSGNLLRVLARYAALRADDFPDPEFDVQHMADELFGIAARGRVKLLTQTELDVGYAMNPETSPGFFYARYFPQAGRKLGYVVRHARELSCVATYLRRTILPSDRQILLPWQFGTRGKLIKLSDAEEAMREGKPLTRAISIGDPSEHYLFFSLYKPIFKRVIERVLDARDSARILIGVRKSSRDWPRLWARVSRFKYVLTTDWSGFDTSIPVGLLRAAWRVLLAAIDATRREDRVFLTNLSNLYENNFVHGIMFHGGYSLFKEGGLPSGSLLTSIVGSVVNYLVLSEYFSCHAGVRAYDIMVYGDDAIVGIDTDDRLDDRTVRRAFLHRMAQWAESRYGMKLSKDKTELAASARAQYHLIQPHYSAPRDVLLAGTRGLKPDGYRPANPWRFSADYAKGYTHRAQYGTASAVHFLGKGFDELGRPIMSTFDTYVRLINPEHPVNSVAEAKQRVLEYACDNVHNKLLINNLSYTYIALSVMEKKLGGRHRRWPRELSQRFKNTSIDEMFVDETILAPEIVRTGAGRLTLDFRANRGYVALYDHPEYGRIIREYEDQLRIRSGWRDVQCDWERLAAAVRSPTPTWDDLVVPHSTPDRGGAAAPTSEARTIHIADAAHHADLDERYMGRRTKLGRGFRSTNEVEARTWAAHARGERNAGIVTGLLFGAWPTCEEVGARIRRDLRRILPVIPRDRPYVTHVDAAGNLHSREGNVGYHWDHDAASPDVYRALRTDAGVGRTFAIGVEGRPIDRGLWEIAAERVARVMNEAREWQQFSTGLMQRSVVVLIWQYVYAIDRTILSRLTPTERDIVRAFARDRGPGRADSVVCYRGWRRGAEEVPAAIVAYERVRTAVALYEVDLAAQILEKTRI